MRQRPIAAIILAAGESTRMGRPKQLLPWGGTTLLAWQVRQMREAGVDEVVVVLGHAAVEVRPAVPPEARVVVNEAYRQGRASSLRCGAAAVSDDAGAVLVLSVDQPRPASLSRRLIERWREKGAPIVSPRFPRRFGHPVLVDGSLLGELRAVIDRHAAEAEALPVEDDRVDVDINTPADYEAALAAFARGAWD